MLQFDLSAFSHQSCLFLSVFFMSFDPLGAGEATPAAGGDGDGPGVQTDAFIPAAVSATAAETLEALEEAASAKPKSGGGLVTCAPFFFLFSYKVDLNYHPNPFLYHLVTVFYIKISHSSHMCFFPCPPAARSLAS
jgi:hypothetical protein